MALPFTCNILFTKSISILIVKTVRITWTHTCFSQYSIISFCAKESDQARFKKVGLFRLYSIEGNNGLLRETSMHSCNSYGFYYQNTDRLCE